METDSEPQDERWLTPGVAGIGAASFFSDAGHEITTAVLPSFLTSTLHASAGALGVIEGLSDALLGVSKLIGGPLANDPPRRRRLATGGYLVTAAATGAVGLARSTWEVGVLRAVSWMARGIRGPARDALLTSLTPRRAYGRAFGLERAGDNLGAVVGPLLASVLVAWIGIRPTMYCAAIPGIFAALAIVVAVRASAHADIGVVRDRARLRLGTLHTTGLTKALLPVVLFEFGNMATTLLILRATNLLHHNDRSFAHAASLAILIYAAHNAFGAIVALLGGHWIDRAGPRVVFCFGAIAYVAAYATFAFSWHSWVPLLVAFCLAGTGIGLAETAESTFVAHLVPDELRGSGFGALGGLQATGDFVSSAGVGVIWSLLSPGIAFGYAATWMALSAIASAWAPNVGGEQR